MKVEQYVMAYEVEQDRIRAILPDGFTSIRPVFRINAEVRDETRGYVEFNTAVERDDFKGWLNIGCWEDVSFERVGKTVTFEMDFLKISFTGVGVEGSCPAEKDNGGCYFPGKGSEKITERRPPETITSGKEFCHCEFAWRFNKNDAHGAGVGKTLPAYPTEVKTIYPKEDFTVENAAKIPCEQVLGAYSVRFARSEEKSAMYFQYGEKEMEYLKKKDKKLAEVIDKIGRIHRSVDTDLFSSVVRNIIGQQISMKAEATIWRRMQEKLGNVTPETISRTEVSELQALGMSFRKAEYISDFAGKVMSREFDLDAVADMSDREAIEALCSLKGIGVWTAEMLLLFCLQRPDILSYGDLAILRGMRMVYHHRKIDKKLFEKYRRRLSPYGSVASLYFWAVAGGAIPGMKDYETKKKRSE